MVHAGSATPKSDRISTNRPDAFLLMKSSPMNGSSEASAVDVRYPVRWRDLTCPFEFEFGNGDGKDVRARNIHLSTMPDDLQNWDKLIWSLHHQLRSDPRRAFSFGVTVDGTRLCVWFGSRIALFKFSSIDWLEVCRQLFVPTSSPHTLLAVPGSTDQIFYLPRIFGRI